MPKHYAILKGPAPEITAQAGGRGPYLPTDLPRIYNFPAGNGAGQKVAFIELGGGFRQVDLDNFFRPRGITCPTVQFVGVDGATNSPSTVDSDDIEVMLDLAVTIGVAPGITPIVYMAPNTIQGFVHAINRAVADRVNIISISWGAAEKYWTTQETTLMNNAMLAANNLKISVFAASGDQGATEGERGLNVDFPGSSPYATGCGGTTLTTNAGNYLSETAWYNSPLSATGGGVSARFPTPSWQSGLSLARRGVPDVSAVADPNTGIIVPVDGANYVVGGTSAAAPFWAGLTAVLNQKLGRNIGLINQYMYTVLRTRMSDKTPPLHDITSGSNNGYSAKKGWDACTGCGSPNGVPLFAALNAIVPASRSSKPNAKPGVPSKPKARPSFPPRPEIRKK